MSHASPKIASRLIDAIPRQGKVGGPVYRLYRTDFPRAMGRLRISGPFLTAVWEHPTRNGVILASTIYSLN